VFELLSARATNRPVPMAIASRWQSTGTASRWIWQSRSCFFNRVKRNRPENTITSTSRVSSTYFAVSPVSSQHVSSHHQASFWPHDYYCTRVIDRYVFCLLKVVLLLSCTRDDFSSFFHCSPFFSDDFNTSFPCVIGPLSLYRQNATFTCGKTRNVYVFVKNEFKLIF